MEQCIHLLRDQCVLRGSAEDDSIGGVLQTASSRQRLKSGLVDVTRADQRNYHRLQPLPYRVATESLSAGEIGPRSAAF